VEQSGELKGKNSGEKRYCLSSGFFYNQHFLGSFSAVLWTMCTCILIVVICIMFSFLGLFHLIKILSQKGFDTFCLFLLSDDYFKGSYLIMLSLLFTCKNAFWSQLV